MNLQKKSSPLISVIMSAYNSEKYIAEAIESILNQTFRNFEFIIFDDGSTDRTKQIIQKYAKLDKRIIAIHNNKNIGYKGFIKNLNKGIKIARGKYLARMDADDISLPKRLETQYQFLETNPTIFLVASSFFYINIKGIVIGRKIIQTKSEDIKDKIVKSGLIVHPTVLFRNDGSAKYREKVFYCEDLDLWLRLISMNKNLAVLPSILLKYRIHETQIGISKKIIQREIINNVLKWHEERKRGNKDSYNKFNLRKLKSFNNQSDIKEIDYLKLKFLFRENKIRQFKREAQLFFKTNGLFYNKRIAILYIMSMLPKKIRVIFEYLFW